jgi:hypothetical protein
MEGSLSPAPGGAGSCVPAGVTSAVARRFRLADAWQGIARRGRSHGQPEAHDDQS